MARKKSPKTTVRFINNLGMIIEVPASATLKDMVAAGLEMRVLERGEQPSPGSFCMETGGAPPAPAITVIPDEEER